MIYADDEHKEFVERNLSFIECENRITNYHCLFYVLGIDKELRSRMNEIFNYSKKQIIISVLNSKKFNPIQIQRIRLSFHLFCGWCYDSDEDAKIGFVSDKYLLNNLINNNLDLYTIQYTIQYLLNKED